MYFDFDLGEGYWGGSAKTLSDFITDAADAYRIQWGAMGLAGTENYTMMVEFYNDALAPEASPTPSLMGFKVTSSDTTQLSGPYTSQSLGYNVSGYWAQQTGPASSFAVPTANVQTGLDTSVAQGILRALVSRQNGGDTRLQSSQGKLFGSGITNTQAAYPSSSKYLYINQSPSTYGDAAGTPNTSGLPIRRIALWDRILTDDEMHTTSRFDRPGVLFSGDSFVSGGQARQEFVKAIEARGKGPIGAAYDGVGSVGLTAHALRYASRPEFWNDYLIIMDGGFETSDGIAAAKAAIDSYLSNITHDKWVLVESNPSQALGTSQRNEWNDFFYGHAGNTGARELYNYVGADHYLKTYDVMLANGDGSSTDNDRIAQGLWPMNVTGDGTHWNTLGHQLAAGLLADYAVAKRWI